MYKDKSSWLTVAKVASLLDLSHEMVYKLVHQGELPAIQIGSAWRIHRDDFEAWLTLCKMKARRIRLPEFYEKPLHDFHQRLKKLYGNRLKSLYLFGSVARGEEDPESDLDVAVVLKTVNDRWGEKKRVTPIAYQVTFGSKHPLLLSTVVISEKELMTSHEPLLSRIREEGRLAA